MSSDVSRVIIRVPFGLNLVELRIALSPESGIERAGSRSHTYFFEYGLLKHDFAR